MITMSVAIAHYPSVTSFAVSSGRWLPPALPATATRAAEVQEPELGIAVPGLDLFFGAALSDMRLSDDYSVVTVEALLDPGLAVLVTL
jgi:hypothetical protein